MSKIARIGIDTSKGSFQLHGVDEKDQVVLRRTLRRKQLLAFMAQLGRREIGLEACGAVRKTNWMADGVLILIRARVDRRVRGGVPAACRLY